MHLHFDQKILIWLRDLYHEHQCVGIIKIHAIQDVKYLYISTETLDPFYTRPEKAFFFFLFN